jgi:hypothetical protein
MTADLIQRMGAADLDKRCCGRPRAKQADVATLGEFKMQAIVVACHKPETPRNLKITEKQQY